MRPEAAPVAAPAKKFQSTHSLRSATLSLFLMNCKRKSFNPRTPCGVRLRFPFQQLHALWFQSTHSLRSATYHIPPVIRQELVSIHALLAECDPSTKSIYHSMISFNPRTPCGVRRTWMRTTSLYMEFQSTHSLRSATSLAISKK